MSKESTGSHPPNYHDNSTHETPSDHELRSQMFQGALNEQHCTDQQQFTSHSSRRLESIDERMSPRSHAPPESTSQMIPRSVASPNRRLGVHSMLNPEADPFDNSRSTHASHGDSSRLPLLNRPSYHSPRTTTEQSVPLRGLHGNNSHMSVYDHESHGVRSTPRTTDPTRSPLVTILERRQPLTETGSAVHMGGNSTYPRADEEFMSPRRRSSQTYPAAAGYVAAAQPPLESLRKGRSPVSRTRRQSGLTESTSPTPSLTPSHSSYAAFARNIEMGRTTPLPTNHLSRASFESSRDSGTRHNSGSQGEEGPFSSESSLLLQESQAQANMRMMPLTSADGTQFYVPVDVQAASKVADEKRARNAGASARFRERRKLKEREASTAIQKLEQQNRELERRNKELETQMGFYRNDRDRLRDIVQRTPTISHLATPPTADDRDPRYAAFPVPSPGSSWNDSRLTDRDIEERPPRRRRLEEHGNYAPFPYATTQPLAYGPRTGHGALEPGTRLPPIRVEIGFPRIDPLQTPTPAPNIYDPHPRSHTSHPYHIEFEGAKRGREGDR